MGLNEISPPGWGGVTSAMKKHHPELKNPWALSHWMSNRKYKAHYKDDPNGTKSKKEPVKKEKYKDEDKPKHKTFKEFLESKMWTPEIGAVIHPKQTLYSPAGVGTVTEIFAKAGEELQVVHVAANGAIEVARADGKQFSFFPGQFVEFRSKAF